MYPVDPAREWSTLTGHPDFTPGKADYAFG